MSPQDWEKVSELFEAVEGLGPPERAAFLDRECGDSPEIRREIESLLAAHSDAGDFINVPIVPDLQFPARENNANSLAGARFGHYVIERSIGSGGMGDVYLALDTRLNRRVALKTLPGVFARDPSFAKRFRNEAKAAAGLNHPNVATVYSVEKINNRPVITMEYVEGSTLDHETPDQGLDIVTFLDWFTCLSDALAHAHERGVVHRDVKPGNIMIAKDGTPKILDFGLARIDVRAVQAVRQSAVDQSITQPGQVIGTPAYMSPEQAEGKDIDIRSDIFSFGVVMYEAITGVRPFSGDSHAEVVSNLLRTDPPLVSKLRPEIPASIARLISRCLVKSPRGRIQSMDEVNSILSEVWTTFSRGSSRNHSLRRLYREFHPTSPKWIVATALLVIVAAVGANYYFNSTRATPAVSFADLTFRRLSQAGDVVYAHITPDGRSIVFNTIEPDEKRAMWIRRVEDKNALQLLPPQQVAFWGGLAISADGSDVFYITADWSARHGTLYKVSSLGGAPRRLVDTVNDLGSLSPDGERMLYVRYGPQVQILSAKTSDGSDETVHYSAAAGTIVRDPHYSSDGRQIYFSKVENVGRIEYWSLIEVPLTGGSERTILPQRRERINELAVLTGGRGIVVNQEDPNSRFNQLYHVDTATGTETRVTNDLNSYFGVSISSQGDQIVTAHRQSLNDIWVGETGNHASFRKVTREPNVFEIASWTPDGRIIYDVLDNNVPHIWMLEPESGVSRQLTPSDSPGFGPRVTPDGRYTIFTSERTGERKLWRMNLDGSEPVLLTNVEGEAFSGRIAPDGRNVYFRWRRADRESLGVIPVDGGDATELPLFGETYWALSSDGSQVAYVIRGTGNEPAKVALRRINEAEPYRILDIDPIHVFRWAPGDKALIYRLREGGVDPFTTLWIQDTESDEVKMFHSSKPNNIFNIDLSADGKRMAAVQGKIVTDAVMLSKVANSK